MQAVLGIDAAWTKKNPSGVALIARKDRRWCCLRLAPSYKVFLDPGSWDAPCIEGGEPDVAALVAASKTLAGCVPAVVAVDMPLSMNEITKRREADQLISEKFGAAKCSVHSPTNGRPGKLAEKMRRAFADTHPLATTSMNAGTHPCLLEVYPHVALLRLTGDSERLKYKITSSKRHTPGPPAYRLEKILKVYERIVAALAQHIDGIPGELMTYAKKLTALNRLKCFEDAIDALVCAWVGSMYLDAQAEAFGDKNAAIWIPVAAGGR